MPLLSHISQRLRTSKNSALVVRQEKSSPTRESVDKTPENMTHNPMMRVKRNDTVVASTRIKIKEGGGAELVDTVPPATLQVEDHIPAAAAPISEDQDGGFMAL